MSDEGKNLKGPDLSNFGRGTSKFFIFIFYEVVDWLARKQGGLGPLIFWRGPVIYIYIFFYLYFFFFLEVIFVLFSV
jgi:hypothetical protein